MSKFKVGDVVKCVEDYLAQPFVVSGGVYVISDVNRFEKTVKINGNDLWWCDSRFEFYSEFKPSQTKAKGIRELVSPQSAEAIIEKKRLTMWHSLREAVKLAGGNPDVFTMETTLEHLIDVLGQNDIAFVYKGK